MKYYIYSSQTYTIFIQSIQLYHIKKFKHEYIIYKEEYRPHRLQMKNSNNSNLF